MLRWDIEDNFQAVAILVARPLVWQNFDRILAEAVIGRQQGHLFRPGLRH